MNNYTVNYAIPGFWEHRKLYKDIFTFLQKNSFMMNDDTNIYCAYGNIPFCTWDGGRIFKKYNQPGTVEEIIQLKNFFNDLMHIKIRLIYTNCLIEERDCYDKFNNTVTSIFHDGENEIVVNSPILEEYLLKNYPNYNYISSTTKCIVNQDEAKNELNKSQYKFICLDYNLNHNFSLLDTLSLEEKEKTEFLVNPICGPACPNRKEHYRLNSLFSLNYGKPYALKNCSIENNISYPHNWNTIITPEEIYSTYTKKGFHYFKLEGRSLSDNTAAIIFAQYIIKPKYQLTFIERFTDND